MSQAFSRNFDRVTPRVKRGGEFAWLTALAVVLVLALILIAGKQRNFYQVGYEVEELRITNGELKKEQARLRAELARLSAPDRIVAESIRIGLRPIPPESRFRVNIDGTPSQPDDPNSGPVMVASTRRNP